MGQIMRKSASCLYEHKPVNIRVGLGPHLISTPLLSTCSLSIIEPRYEKTGFQHNYVKTKTQISFMVTAKLISAFVFATRIVQSLYCLNTKFQASSHLLWLYSPVCVKPGRKPRRPVFSQRGSIDLLFLYWTF